VERKRLQGVFKARAKHDREVFLNNLCDELETDIKAIRLLSGKRKVTGTTIHKSDGSPCLSEEETLERWHEHFISTLNHHPGVPSNELDNEAASTPVDTSVSIDEPSVEEVYAAIKRLRNGCAPGPGGIPPAELYELRAFVDAFMSVLLLLWMCPWTHLHLQIETSSLFYRLIIESLRYSNEQSSMKGAWSGSRDLF